jgi:glutathione S-transferase
VLVESTLIIDYLEHLSGKSLLPSNDSGRTNALRIIGIALVAGEKVAQLIYETTQRPKELQHGPWIERLSQQLASATELLEESVGDGASWFGGSDPCQADITTAIIWRFIQHVVPERIAADNYPGLVRFSARAEALAQFIACPLS